jgi:hypothetical protein
MLSPTELQEINFWYFYFKFLAVMKTGRILISLIPLLSIIACTKDKVVPKPEETQWACGTVFILPEWTQTLSDTALAGNWSIESISYHNTLISMDTIYYPGAIISLNPGGTGMLNNQSIQWKYSPAADHFPQLYLVNIGSLYSFQIGFNINDTITTQIESYQDSNFVAHTGKYSDDWAEDSWIYFKRL